MYTENKYYGDDGSVGEELLINISELEQKSQAVDKAVGDGYFNLEQALLLYKLTEKEYIAYLLLKNNKKPESKQKQFLEALSFILYIFHEASNKFDTTGKKIIHELETYSKEFH